MTQLEELRGQIDDLAGQVYMTARVAERMRRELEDLYYRADVVEEFWHDTAVAILKGSLTVDEAYDMAMEEPMIDFHDMAKELTERGVDVSDVEWL